MQFKKVNNKEHHHSLVVRGFFMNAHVSEFHMLFVWGVLVCALSVNLQRCEGRCQLIVQAVFPTPFLPLSTVYSVWWVPVSLSCVRTHGWVARICQPWEKSPSRNWLPIVEAFWMLQAPNLHLTMQLLKVTFLQWCRLVMIYCAHNWFFRRVHFIIPASKQTKDKTRRG